MTPDLDIVQPEEVEETTYIVSGHPRSGTSMMMKSLIAGGLKGAYRDRVSNMDPNNPDDGPRPYPKTFEYEANPGGFYELGAGSGKFPEFPNKFIGKVIKVIYRGLPMLYPAKYKVVYMLRDPDEIALSMSRIRDGKRPMRPRRHGWSRPADYFALMKHFILVATNRSDMEVLQVWYGDVLEDPVKAFERIKEFGIPIDPEKAAEIVTHDLYRNRA